MIKKLFQIIIVILCFLLFWQILIWIFDIQRFFLPPPLSVLKVLIENFTSLMLDAKITLVEIILGLTIGIIVGYLSAILISLYKSLEHFFLPALVLLQAVPVFAIAPILVLWLGYGMPAKITMAAIIIYFPIVANFYDGLRRTPDGFIDLAQTMKANSWQILFSVKVKAALPMLGSGLKIAATFAPIAAIIGEWVGASAGLGYRMLYANARLQTAEMFAALLILITMTLILYYTIDVLIKVTLPWANDL